MQYSEFCYSDSSEDITFNGVCSRDGFYKATC